MKKLIAILTIAIVLVGAVFADPDPTEGVDSASQTHSLTIQAAVYGRLPSFGLKVVKVNGDPASDAVASVETNSSKDPFYTNNTTYAGSDDVVLSDTDDDQDANGLASSVFTLDRPGSITVQAFTRNDAKVLKTYQIEFYGGQFTEIYRHGLTTGETGVYNPTSITVTGKAVNGSKFTTTDGTTSSLSGIDRASAAWVPANNKVDIKVNFTLEETPENTPLAECTFMYSGDDDINPGNYYATIGMVVTSV